MTNLMYLPEFDRCVEALHKAKLYAGTAADVRRAKAIVAEMQPAMADYLFMRGVAHAVDVWCKRNPRKAGGEALRREKVAAEAKIRAEQAGRLNAVLASSVNNARKAAEYDKVVELLDVWMVGGTKLGDCTKEKLVAEAGKLAHAAKTAKRHAGAYTRLAAELKPGETVRRSTKRAALLDIIKAVLL